MRCASEENNNQEASSSTNRPISAVARIHTRRRFGTRSYSDRLLTLILTTEDATSSSSSDASDRTQIKCQPMKIQHSDDVMEVACVDVIISNVSDDNEVSMN